MENPQWLIAAMMFAGQLATAVGIVFAIRGHVQRVEQRAEQAYKSASEAHRRIDTQLTRGNRYGTSQA